MAVATSRNNNNNNKVEINSRTPLDLEKYFFYKYVAKTNLSTFAPAYVIIIDHDAPLQYRSSINKSRVRLAVNVSNHQNRYTQVHILYIYVILHYVHIDRYIVTLNTIMTSTNSVVVTLSKTNCRIVLINYY